MRALSAAIRNKKFSPAYLLFGEDEYRKEDALRHLLDAAVDPATRDFNLDQRRGAEIDAETLSSLLAMPPMMAERRVIVIRDVATLKKDARVALERYLASPSSDLLLVLTAAADTKADRVLAELTEPVESKPLTGAEIPKWIRGRVERLGATISDEALDLLLDAVGNDLGPLALEVDKLVAYTSGKPIDETAVTAVVGIRREETLAHLLDAVAAKDVRLALSLVPGVMEQPKMSGVFAVMTLTTQMLAFAIAAARGGRSYNDFMGILKSGSSNVSGRAWGEAAGAWSRHAARWTLPELDHALAALLQADLSLKSSRVSSEEQVIATAILAMCGGATLSHAA